MACSVSTGCLRGIANERPGITESEEYRLFGTVLKMGVGGCARPDRVGRGDSESPISGEITLANEIGKGGVRVHAAHSTIRPKTKVLPDFLTPESRSGQQGLAKEQA